MSNVYSFDNKVEFLNTTLHLPSGINEEAARRIAQFLEDTQKRALLLKSHFDDCPKRGFACPEARAKAKVHSITSTSFPQ